MNHIVINSAFSSIWDIDKIDKSDLSLKCSVFRNQRLSHNVFSLDIVFTSAAESGPICPHGLLDHRTYPL